MKKIVSVLLVAVMVFTLCVWVAPQSASAQENERFTLGFILGSREHMFYVLVEQGILAAAEELGFTPIVLESNLSGAIASERIQQLVVENVDAISLAVNEPAASNVAIEAAHAEGMPMFVFDARTDLTDVIICFVGTDNYEGGVLGGQVTIQTLRDLGLTGGGGATIGIIAYPEPQSTIDREAGWYAYVRQFEEQYNLTIVNIGNYRGQADIAMNQMSDALIMHPDMAVIFTVGSPASVGALAAIKSAGASTKIIGFDANPEAHAAILDPVDGAYWIADIAQDPIAIGRGIAQQKMLYLTEGRVDAAEILISPFVVDASNAVMP
jgi:ribose transport system substrate-binding protein